MKKRIDVPPEFMYALKQGDPRFRFKRGDRVRIIKTYGDETHPLGTEGEVIGSLYSQKVIEVFPGVFENELYYIKWDHPPLLTGCCGHKLTKV